MQARKSMGACEWNKINLEEHDFAKCTLCIGRVLKRIKNFL